GAADEHQSRENVERHVRERHLEYRRRFQGPEINEAGNRRRHRAGDAAEDGQECRSFPQRPASGDVDYVANEREDPQSDGKYHEHGMNRMTMNACRGAHGTPPEGAASALMPSAHYVSNTRMRRRFQAKSAASQRPP